jgi:hypothetical protein
VDSDGDVTTGSQQFQRFRFVASGGETTISGADANGAVLAYTAGLEQVVLNGAVLVRGYDYTATTGTTITGLSPALVASDVLEVFSFIAFTVANTYTQSQVDGLVDAAPGMKLIVPASVTNGTVGATGAITFSGVSSVSLNNFISSSYSNYKIVSTITGSTNLTLGFKFRENVTDKSTNYYGASWYYRFDGTSGVAATRNNGSDAVIGATKSGGYCISEFLYTVPNTTDGIITGQSYDDNSTGGWNFTYKCGATAVTGASIIASTGNMTGTIRVYGFKN